MSTYRCQSELVWFSLIRRICLSGAWFLSRSPIVCACFSVQCLSWTSSNCANSLIRWEVNAVPRSQIMVDGMYECRRKIDTSVLATKSASPFSSGTAKRYLENTSIADRIKV